MKELERPELFKAFMRARFPQEKDESYISTWRDRFSSGNPVAYMDSESKAIYIKLLTT